MKPKSSLLIALVILALLTGGLPALASSTAAVPQLPWDIDTWSTISIPLVSRWSLMLYQDCQWLSSITGIQICSPRPSITVQVIRATAVQAIPGIA